LRVTSRGLGDVYKRQKVNSQNLMHGLKIKQLWLDSKTTNEQKAYIWLYFQKLLRTGEKVLL
jgi:hypothetical protein